MKRFLSLIALIASLALVNTTAEAGSSYPLPKQIALAKPNPAKPIAVTSGSVTQVGDAIVIDFTVEGIGYWCLWMVPSNNPFGSVCLCGWTLNTKATEVIMVVPCADYSGCWVSVENVHGLPPLFP